MKLICTLAYVFSTSIASASIKSAEMVFLFNSKNIYDCIAISNSARVADFRSQGWLTSIAGICVPEPDQFRMCGMGGARLNNPKIPHERFVTNNTCETEELEMMGWVQER